MKLAPRFLATGLVAALLHAPAALATNPLIMDQFTADPTVRVFEGKLYMYPSHDIKEPPGYAGRPNWFVMEDYHVFSSENLTDWQDHGVIVTQTGVEWTNPTAYAMWAPDCVFKDGKYYFYFPAMAKSGGMRIGVAIADKPYGPFVPEPSYIEGVSGIDPNVLIDKDGTAYLYWSGEKIFVAKLKPNMREIEGEPLAIENLPKKGLQEGPFAFERNGIYYLTYPHVANRIERLEYATSTSPMGPFEWQGVILDESESGCWTVHHSLVEYQGQWYLFYHDRDLSPDFDKNRSARADKLFFNADGSIQKVVPTLRGVGLVAATSRIQIDRYSERSGEQVTAEFVDDANTHAGWKAAFDADRSWVRFDDVDFAAGGQKSLEVRAWSPGGGAIEVRLESPVGPLLARVRVNADADWQTTSVAADDIPSGVRNLVVMQSGAGPVDVDWIRFQ